MKQNTALYLAVTAACGLIGFTIGSVLLGRLCIAMLIVALLSFLSVLMGSAGVRVSVTMETAAAQRGQTARLTGKFHVFSVIPLGGVDLTAMDGRNYTLDYRTFQKDYSNYLPWVFEHVGEQTAGFSRVTVRDMFGLFEKCRDVSGSALTVLVLPNCPDDLTLPPHKDRSISGGRVKLQEDASEPSSVREWEDGDSLRRMHWKLTMKTLSPDPRTLRPMVKTYEEEERPETLILVDASEIRAVSGRASLLRDGACECALGMVKAAQDSGVYVRLLLCGESLTELPVPAGGTAEAAALLAKEPFVGYVSAERLVSEATRRMDTSGQIVFVTANLTERFSDMLIRLAAYSGISVTLCHVYEPQEEGNENLNTNRLTAGNVNVLPFPARKAARK